LKLRNSSSIATFVQSELRLVALPFFLAACPKLVDLLLERFNLAKMFFSQPFHILLVQLL
jgi:hypothetical protein